MWLSVTFQPIGLFSLRPFNSTSSGGKTLLVPTPFAFKMALLDVLWREQGDAVVQARWQTIRDAAVAIRLPPRLVVNNTFVKILRTKKKGPSDDNGTGLITPLTNTIAYREYVTYNGTIGIALRGEGIETLLPALTHINYLGKRGGFMQLTTPPHWQESLSSQWTDLTTPTLNFPIHGTLQMLDDCGGSMTLNQANIYHSDKLKVNDAKGRMIRHVVLPLQATSSSRSYTLYQHL